MPAKLIPIDRQWVPSGDAPHVAPSHVPQNPPRNPAHGVPGNSPHDLIRHVACTMPCAASYVAPGDAVDNAVGNTPGTAPKNAPQDASQPGSVAFACPRCGRENPASAYFCISCHQILIHRCPQCWHEQRTGPICENCGTNMPLFWEVALEKTMEEENRLGWARMWAAATWITQILMLPFSSVGGLARALALRLISARLRPR